MSTNPTTPHLSHDVLGPQNRWIHSLSFGGIVGRISAYYQGSPSITLQMIKPQLPLTLPISELNILIRDWVDACPPLTDIWVSGEIGNFRRLSGSQRYFTLSEKESSIQCVIFDAQDARFDGPYKDGVTVLARGKVRYFNRRGSLQFQINYMMPKGTGSIAENLAILKQKLDAEGLFNPERKVSLPKFPSKIALITAPGSAAMADVTSLLQHHAPYIEIVVVPAVMQGNACSQSVIDALSYAESDPSIEIILISRGGGSAEDLLPFSEEKMVRQIALAKKPVVTAIGHEIDSTLSDLAADLHFPTPSAAAIAIGTHYQSLSTTIIQVMSHATHTITALIDDTMESTIQLHHDLQTQMMQIERQTETRCDALIRELHLLSPLRKLTQGFSIARSQKGHLLRSISDTQVGDHIELQVTDGTVISSVLTLTQCQK